MGLFNWIEKAMGATQEYPDASELNKLNQVPPAPEPTASQIFQAKLAAMPPVPPPTPITTGKITLNSNFGSFTNGSIISGNIYSIPSYNIGAQGAAVPSAYSVGSPSSPTLITFYDKDGQWVVKLDRSGHVTWSNGENITEAAKAFATMLTLGVEQKAGIVQSMKLRIRDQIFEEVIRMAQERGPLTADDLTFMLESSKIIEKLKGTDE